MSAGAPPPRPGRTAAVPALPGRPRGDHAWDRPGPRDRARHPLRRRALPPDRTTTPAATSGGIR
ncbi:hypothetical protein [Streptomyces platensis]|uniref:hypothetical protein n=1 Tax=Streptomyces platensis TaxID=58346 RepID=UPI0036770A9A